MRLTTICRMLTIILWAGGMVVLGLFIIWTMASPERHITRTAVNLILETIIEMDSYGNAEDRERFKKAAERHYEGRHQARGHYRKAVRHWATWYYSPLNIYYWGVALLVFSPAVGMQLLSHWLRKRS